MVLHRWICLFRPQYLHKICHSSLLLTHLQAVIVQEEKFDKGKKQLFSYYHKVLFRSVHGALMSIDAPWIHRVSLKKSIELTKKYQLFLSVAYERFVSNGRT